MARAGDIKVPLTRRVVSGSCAATWSWPFRAAKPELGAPPAMRPRKCRRGLLSNFFYRYQSLRPSRNYQLTTHYTMRPLTEPETKTLFEKLATYCGKGIANLIDDPASKDDRMVFRVQVSAREISMAREQEY